MVPKERVVVATTVLREDETVRPVPQIGLIVPIGLVDDDASVQFPWRLS